MHLFKLKAWQIAMNCILLCICISLPLFSIAQATADKTAKTGDWHRANTWTPTGVPEDGDVILIPEGEVVSLRGTDHTLQDAILIIEGELIMESKDIFGFPLPDYGSLTFIGEGSGIIIEDGGKVIDGTDYGGDTHFLSVLGETVWSGDNCSSNCGTVVGDYTSIGTATAMPKNLNNPLPVELLSFQSEVINNKVALYWTTSMEDNFDFFTVERAGADKQFQGIGDVKGVGFSTVETDYQFRDINPLPDLNFYRLKATDLDGTVEYHNIIAVWVEKIQTNVNIYPNPLRANDHLFINTNSTKDKDITITDLSGRLILKTTVSAGISQIELPESIKQGCYIVSVPNTIGETQLLRLIIN